MKGSSPLIMIAAVAVMILVMVPAAVLGQTSPSECYDEKNKLENGCRSVIFGRNPTAACCKQVRAAHVECVCPLLTPKLVAAIGGPQRIIRLIHGCGRTLPRNFKCGSVSFKS